MQIKDLINQILCGDALVGSGTTGVVAKKLGRNFIGIDLSEKYCEMANKRIRRKV